MAKIVWIASYPRSGNTWVRFIVSNLYLGSVTRSCDVELVVPDVHRFGDRCFQNRDHPFVKTHWMCGTDLPHFADTLSAVYMVRNPLDVLVSIMAYRNLASRTKRAEFMNEILGASVKPPHKIWHKKWKYGTWPESVQSWTSPEHNFPRLVLRYEDMLADHRGAVKKISDFFQLARTKKEIDAVVAHTTFDVMDRMEKVERSEENQEGLFRREAADKEDFDFTFMRRGVMGSYREVLEKKDIDRLLERFGPTMREAGYDPDTFR